MSRTYYPDHPELFRWEETEGGIKVVGYGGVKAFVQIPSEINGKPVVAIGSKLQDFDFQCSIKIPASVERIDPDALGARNPVHSHGFTRSFFTSFELEDGHPHLKREGDFLYGEGGKKLIWCYDENITDVVIPEGVTTIGTYTFCNCPRLANITLPATLEVIEDFAFMRRQGPVTCPFPEGLKKIGSHVFEPQNGYMTYHLTVPASLEEIGCSASIQWEGLENHPHLMLQDSMILSKDGKKLFAFHGDDSATDVIIPEGVEEILPDAFSNVRSLKKITFPTTLKVIRSGAFCANRVKTLRIPASLENIEDDGYDYSGLGSILVDKKNTHLYTDKICLFRILEEGKMELLTCFRNKLEEYEIPEGTVSIAPDAFTDCTMLKTLTLPQSLEVFDENSFGIQLKKLVVPAGVKEVRLSSKQRTTADFTSSDNPNLFWEDDVLYLNTPDGLIALAASAKAKEISLKEGTVRISSGVHFSGCTRIVFPASLRRIEPYAFWHSSLTEVVFNEGLESIGDCAFALSGIASVTIPASVSFIHRTAFWNCPMEHYQVAEGSACYASVDGALYSADRTVLYDVPYNTKQKEFTVPESVVEVGMAFAGCEKIQSVRLPSGLKNLWRDSFNNCVKLKHLYLGDALEYVHNLFIGSNCTTTLHFAANPALLQAVEQLYSGSGGKCNLKLAISGMEDLAELTQDFALIPNATGVTIAKNLSSKKDIVIPERIGNYAVTKIGPNAFAESWGSEKLESIQIPGTVTVIGKKAFEYCRKLSSVTIAPGVKVIEENAFHYCATLTQLILPEGVEEIGDCALFGCEALAKVVFPASTTKISPMVFACDASGQHKDLYLKDQAIFLVVPGSYAESFLRGYKRSGWGDPKPLTVVYDLPESTPATEEEQDALKYLNYNIQEDGTVQVEFKSYQDIPQGIIPNTIMGMKVTKVSGLSSLPNAIVRLSIPANVTSITGLYRLTFYRERPDMTGIDVAEENETYWSDGDALYTKDRSVLIHMMNPQLEEYTVHPDTKVLEAGSFGCMRKLKKLVLPEGLQEIREQAFDECPALAEIVGVERVPTLAPNVLSVTPWYQNQDVLFNGTVLTKYSSTSTTCCHIPEGTTEIANNAFAIRSTDDHLEEIIIPDSVRVISPRAFAGRKKLKKIRLPAGLKKLEDRVLNDCTAIETIHLPAGLEEIAITALPSTQVSWMTTTPAALREITVDPDNAVFMAVDGVLYSKDGGTLLRFPGAYPATEFTVPDSVHTIGEGAFQLHTGLHTVHLGAGVKNIGKNAFSKCTALANIDVSHVETFGEYAFNGCTALTAVTLNAPVIGSGIFSACSALSGVTLCNTTVIGNDAFYNCSALKEIQLPDGLEIIRERAFGACGLTQVTVPKSVRSVSYEAFSGCPEITVYDSIDPDAKPAAKHCDEFNGSPNSQVGFIGIGRSHAMWSCAANHTWIDHEIIVRSAETDEIKYKVSMFSDPKQRSYYCTLTSSWGKNAGFNFAALDAFFPNIKGVPNKLRVALNRLRWPVELSEGSKEAYIAYLSKSAKDLVKTCVNTDDMETFLFCVPFGILKKNNIDELIEYATKAKAVSFAAYMMEYKNEHFAPKKGGARMPSLSVKAAPDWQAPKTGTSKIGRYKGNDTVVEFPAEYKGKPITGIAATTSKVPDNYKLITSVVIPEGYTSIGDYAFCDCVNLESVTLPSTLETIGAYAFSGCKKLKEIILPDSVTFMDSMVFGYCEALTTVRLSRNLKAIPLVAFYGCSSLTEIELPHSITSVGKDAFADAQSLKKLVVRSHFLQSFGQIFWNPPEIYAYAGTKFDVYGIRKKDVRYMTIAEQAADTLLAVQIGDDVFNFFLENAADTMQKTGAAAMVELFAAAGNGAGLVNAVDKVYGSKIRSAANNAAEIARMELADPASAKTITVTEEKKHPDGDVVTIFTYKPGKKSTMKTKETLAGLKEEKKVSYRSYYGSYYNSYAKEEKTKEKDPNKGFVDITDKASATPVTDVVYTEVESITFEGKIFVLSGFGATDESAITKTITDKGGEVKSSVVLKTDYLIMNENYGGVTAKYTKAVELNGKGKSIAIISSKRFHELAK